MVAANACTVNQAKSVASTKSAQITFVNQTNETVRVYWLNFSGQRVLYKSLPAGQSYTQNTYITHPWVVLDPSGKCVGSLTAAMPSQTYVIRVAADSPEDKKAKTCYDKTVSWNLKHGSSTRGTANVEVKWCVNSKSIISSISAKKSLTSNNSNTIKTKSWTTEDDPETGRPSTTYSGWWNIHEDRSLAPDYFWTTQPAPCELITAYGTGALKKGNCKFDEL